MVLLLDPDPLISHSDPPDHGNGRVMKALIKP
jgi:hypothetical protein